MAFVTVEPNNVWIERPKYEDAESKYYESLNKTALTPLASEVAKARQHLIECQKQIGGNVVLPSVSRSQEDSLVLGLKAANEKLEQTVMMLLKKLEALETRFSKLEGAIASSSKTTESVDLKNVAQVNVKAEEDEDDGVDLFGSDSDEESETAAKIREERLAAYHAKKSKKPVLIAKSNVILDVKPWDDETDMKLMESKVREIVHDGLLWGAAKLVPLAFGIHKLQISCVVEDDKVSIDWLQEQIEAQEDFVQSVDIAAFNKI